MKNTVRVLICTLNSKYIHSSLAPWCLYVSAKEYCGEDCSFSVVEGTINEKREDILRRIISRKPDIVSFSCYIWNIKKTLSLCKAIKDIKSDTVIALGGPEAAYNQQSILTENPCVDFVLSGEGERLFPRFIEGVKNKDCTDIPGVSCINEGRAIVSFAEESEETDYPSPYCEEYFASLSGRIAYIESSRGCPYSCAFCLSGRCGKLKFFPLEKVKEEMLSLASKGAKIIKFVDRTFNCNKDRARDILLFIKENYAKKIADDVCFHFEIAADILDDDLIELIASMPSGSIQLEAGIQSFNEKTLSAIGRRNSISKTEENILRLTEKGNCHIHIDLIAGLPEESYESFIKGFDRAYGLGADMLQLGFLKILHGSPMGQDREKYPCTYSSEPPYEVISTPWINKEELDILRKTENELERLSNSGRFRRTLSYIFEKTDISPYKLFNSLALFLEHKEKTGSIPLDEYTCLVYDFLSGLDSCDKKALRDKMLYDRIATNNSGVIPERLKVKDDLLKRVRKELTELFPEEKGVNRTVGILYSEEKVIWSDYKIRSKVTGEYEVREIYLKELFVKEG